MKKHPVFAVADCLPISEYRFLAAQERGTFAVRPDILRYVALRGGTVRAVCESGEYGEEEEIPLEVDEANGQVYITAAAAGAYVAVADGLSSSLPVETHWSAAENGGRGGLRPGAADGIGQLRLHPETGLPEVELVLRDREESNPYYYRSAELALFADGQGGEERRVPAYEHYIGETYSLVAVTVEAVCKLSEDSIKQTGYPVLIRSADCGMCELQGVPAFQIIHGRLIGGEINRSLVSYVLPPYWTPSPDTRYPMVFSGFYDQNENVFKSVGPFLLKVLGKSLQATGRGAIGIIWNGGGAQCSRTIQASIYDNLDQLFQIAIDEYAADGAQVITVGGSRGGITSLLAAGNPHRKVYTVRYALGNNVPLGFGKPIEEMLNPTCPVLPRIVCEDTGYKQAWRPEWVSPEGDSALELFYRNVLGTSDYGVIEENVGPASERLLQVLQQNGTQVWLTQGTHDPFTSGWLCYEWVARARRKGICVRHEIGYRSGHNDCSDAVDRTEACLNALIRGEALQLDGTWHYRRSSEEPEAWEHMVAFRPSAQPVFVEGPKFAIRGYPFLLVLCGQPGLHYRLTLQETGKADREVCLLMEGVLEQQLGDNPHEPAFAYVKALQTLPDEIAAGIYAYELTIRKPNSEEWERLVGHAPQPGSKPRATMELLDHLPDYSEDAWLDATMSHAIGWGLSEV